MNAAAGSQLSAQTSVTVVRRSGADSEYGITKEHLDFLLVGVRQMPSSGRFFQNFGWFLVGVAVTAAIEANNAAAGSEHRHEYVVVAIASLAAGLVSLLCARSLRKEQGNRAEWIETYLLDLYTAFGLEPPPPKLGWWAKAQIDSAQSKAREAAERAAEKGAGLVAKGEPEP